MSKFKATLDVLVTASLEAIRGMSLCDKWIADPATTPDNLQMSINYKQMFRQELDDIAYIYSVTLED